jgi:ribosomal protein S18 acetylase RimI-like enzyme
VSLEVRKAVAADEAAVFDLLPQLLGEERAPGEQAREVFRRLLSGDRGTALVAVEGERLLGVITVSYVDAVRYGGRYAQIEELVVDEAARGKNAGAALVQASIEAAREAGCREIGLYAREHNRPFYEKYGFTYAGPELRQRLD